MNKHFIKVDSKYCSLEEHVAAPYLRRVFELDFEPENAHIAICGLGFYELYVNGTNITKGALAPYISNPDDYCYYDVYDIAKLLKKGENAVGVILGNGMFNQFGGSVWEFDKAQWRGAPCVALEFSASGSGKSLEFIADEKFRTHSSPITFDDLRMGEYYDARLEIENWNMPEFDDSEWNSALEAETPRGELKLCTADPIKPVYEIKPKNIKKQENGYLYDFGVNCAGVCRLEINAEEGQKITLWHGEILENGEFSYNNIIFDRPDTQFYKEYNQKDIYIAKGIGEESYMPKFTYHGFRYVLVQGITEEQANSELLTYIVMNSDLKHIGGFKCSDDVSNKLFEMVQRSDLSNFYYFPTDCPHREKNGWTGDASASAEHMALLYDVEASWREWLGNIRKSQNDRGELPGIVPTAGWGYEWGNGPAWDSVLFSLPYQLFKKRGNTEVIKENAHAMIRYLEYILTRRNENGTVSVGLGDWVPVGRAADDYNAPLELTDSVMVMEMAREAAEMLNAIGYTHQADFANAVYKDMRGTIRRELIDFNSMLAAGESQTGQAMLLYYGVFEKDEEEKAFSRLLELIHKNNDCFDCGYLGLRTVFHVLAHFNKADLAYDMITRKDYPSYGHLIELGETTLPEQFMPDGVPCGSHNHHFLGDIANWYMSEIAGINVVNSEYVQIKPNFIRQLNYASAYYGLPGGRVSVSWKRTENHIELEVECPVAFDVVLTGEYGDETVQVKKICR